jgi:hypothetical protein
LRDVRNWHHLGDVAISADGRFAPGGVIREPISFLLKRYQQRGTLAACVKQGISNHMSTAIIEHADGLPLPAAQLGHPDDCARSDYGGDGRRHRKRCSADNCSGSRCQSRIFNLDRQRLTGDHYLAAATRFPGRDHRLSPRLFGGFIAFHTGVAVLRLVTYAAPVDRGANCAGIWRGRDHERQFGAGPIHIPTRSACTWYRLQCSGDSVLCRGRTHGGFGHSGGGNLAVLIRNQHPTRNRRTGVGLALSSAHPGRQPHLRLAKRRAQRGHLRSWNSRHRQCRPWREPLRLSDGIWDRSRCLPALGSSADGSIFTVIAFGSFAHSHLRIVCLHLGCVVLRPDAGIRGDAILSRKTRFGYSAVQMGLLITPWPIAIAFAAPLAGRLVERYSAGLLGGIGLILFAAGLGTLALLPDNPSATDIVWRMALSGAGFGLFQTPNNRTMIAAAPRERSGGASGVLGTARLLGQTLGASLVALLLARYPAEGTQISLMVGVAFALFGAALSILRLSSAGARGAEAIRVRESQRLKGE